MRAFNETGQAMTIGLRVPRTTAERLAALATRLAAPPLPVPSASQVTRIAIDAGLDVLERAMTQRPGIAPAVEVHDAPAQSGRSLTPAQREAKQARDRTRRAEQAAQRAPKVTL